jgi:hypothetical protein
MFRFIFLPARHQKWFSSVAASITVKSAVRDALAATAEMVKELLWGLR